MNIFVLDTNPELCAKYHSDKHVVKMLLETAQLLCSAYYFTGKAELSPYKLTHAKHPCSIWTRESLANWRWLRQLAIELYKEYKYRYNNKIHKSGELILQLQEPNLIDIGLTKFCQCMDFQYKNFSPVQAYRDYYKGAKQHLLQYTRREIPNWLQPDKTPFL